MKTYEEMAQSALNKIGEEEKNREKRRKNVTKIAGSAVSLCLVAAIGVGVWQSGLIGKVSGTNDLTAGTETTAQINIPDEPEKQIAELPAETSAKETADAGNNTDIPGDTVMDACHFIWRNKVVMYGSLYWAIENDPDGIYTVRADFRPTAEKAGDFTFEGETMTGIAGRADEEKYARAFNAYVETVLPAEMAKLTEAGIPCERTAGKNNSLTITVTADQLENLPLSDITVWLFDNNNNTAEIGDPDAINAIAD